MASITPRASGFWADSRMSYFPDDEGDVEEQQNLIPDNEPNDGRTPLDKTIDRIGMGMHIVFLSLHSKLLSCQGVTSGRCCLYVALVSHYVCPRLREVEY
jgi:hypothetical protein